MVSRQLISVLDNNVGAPMRSQRYKHAVEQDNEKQTLDTKHDGRIKWN